MVFEDAFLRSPEAENSESEREIARLNEEEAALESGSERKKKWRNLFLAASVFAGSFAGNLMAEKNAFAGTAENEANQKKVSSRVSYNQEDFIKAMESQDDERRQELYQRALEKIKAEVQKERDYSGIKNPSLRRSAEDSYKRARLGMRAIMENPEKVKTKLIDDKAVLLSVDYENPDTGALNTYDYFYQLVEKK